MLKQWAGCVQLDSAETVLIHALIDVAVKNFDDKRFYDLDRQRQLSWRDMLFCVARFYRYLHLAQIERGQTVVTIAQNRWELLAIEFACQIKGVVFTPLYEKYPTQMIGHCLDVAKPAVMVVAGRDQYQQLSQCSQMAGLEHLVVLDNKSAELAAAYGRNEGQLIDFAIIDGELAADQAFALNDEALSDELLQAIEQDLQQAKPEQPFCLMFTSGSSGKPKGVLLAQSNILSQQQALAEVWQFDGPQSFLSYLPWHHSFGGLFEKYTALFSRAVLNIDNSRGVDIALLFKNMAEIKPTRFFSVPKLLTIVANEMKCSSAFKSAVAPGLQMIFSAASKLPDELNRFYSQLAINVVEGWGLTETSPCITITSSDSKLAQGVGSPLPKIEIKADEDTQEISVKGPNVMLGYYGDPQATERCFDGSWFKTGDIGKIIDNELQLLGRMDGVKKLSNGEKVSSFAIEQSLLDKSPMISHAAIVIENRPYATALVFINPEACEQVFGEHQSIGNCPKLNAHLTELLQQYNADVDDASHQLLALAVTDIPLSVAKGEVTPSFKISQATVLHNYHDICNVLYDPDVTFDGQNAYHGFIKVDTLEQSIPQAQPLAANRLDKAGFAEVVGRIGGLDDNALDWRSSLHDLGYNSMAIVQLATSLSRALGQKVSEIDLYSSHSVEHLWQLIGQRFAACDTSGDSAGNKVMGTTDKPSVSIIGYAGQFPDAPDCQSLWANLLAQKSAVSDVPGNRPFMDSLRPLFKDGGTSLKGAFIDDVTQFNCEFFHISPKEASQMDPQHRLFLNTTYEAIEQANLDMETIKGSNTGVFVGISQNGYRELMREHQLQHGIDALPTTAVNNQNSVIANRLSYYLDLKGPSFCVDTLCSSSLVALHQARLSIENGECEMAIVAGVHLQLDVTHFAELNRLEVLSKDGVCRPFDASANGTVLGEGVGVVILKRQDLAEADDNRQWATLMGSSVYHGGRSNGITAPDPVSQQRLVEQCWAQAGISGEQLGYIETHGTGTKLGDQVELAGLSACIGEQQMTTPCYLGAIKANIGHLEAAAGIAGLIKLLMIGQHRTIVPATHYNKLNERIQLPQGRLHIPTEALPLAPEKTCLGISSFGMGGTGAHVVIKSIADNPADVPLMAAVAMPLVVSGVDQEHLQSVAGQMIRFVEQGCQDQSFNLAGLCAGSVRRSRLNCAVVLVVKSAACALERLAQVAEGQLRGYHYETPDEPPTVLVFAGQGTQSAAMAAELYHNTPRFAHWIDKIHQMCLDACQQAEQPGVDIKSLLLDENSSQDINSTEYAQVALFAFEYALYQSIKPALGKIDMMIGHSLGELVAACVAGVFALEDGIKIVLKRAQLMGNSDPHGAMLMCRCPVSTLKPMLGCAPYDQLAVAVENADNNIVLSGLQSILLQFKDELEEASIKARFIRTNRAFHSPLMSEAAAAFEQFLQQFDLQSAAIPIISNLTARPETECFATPLYWQRQMLGKVSFAQSLAQLQPVPGLKLLELGPMEFLESLLPESLLDHQAAVYSPAYSAGSLNYPDILKVLAQDLRPAARHLWMQLYGEGSSVPSTLPVRKLPTKAHWYGSHQAPFDAQPEPEVITAGPDAMPVVVTPAHEQDLIHLMQQQINCMNTIFTAQSDVIKGL